MLTVTIVEDYVFAAMRRARGTKTDDGTYILTVPDFPGIVACASDVPGCFDELYRLLEGWVDRSIEHGFDLPPMQTDDGAIDLNSDANRTLAGYHHGHQPKHSSNDQSFLNGPEELEEFFSELDRTS